MEKLFFELIQVAIGSRKSLSRVPSAAEWGELYAMATRQALTGVCFVAVQKLSGSSDVSCLPELLRLKWLGMAAKIQQRNQVVNEACVELVRQYTHDGLSCCILKGQGNLVNYPEELREARNPGDIDVWCKTADPCGVEIAVGDLDGKGAHYEHYAGIRGVIEYVKQLHRIAGSEIHDGIRYHHVDAPSVNGVSVEVHFRPIYFDNPIRNRRLQRWFEENEQFNLCDATALDKKACLQQEKNTFSVPSVSFNVVYQLAHINKHLFEEGIGLRQLMDYYFVLRALHFEQGSLADRTQSMAQWAEGMGISVMSNTEIMHQLKRLDLKKLAGAVMYVLKEVFAMPDVYLICEPDEKTGRHLLDEIMMAGNFGKFDPRKGDLSHESSAQKFMRKTKRNLLLARYYPGEALWEPPFRLYHFFWRKLELWKF